MEPVMQATVRKIQRQCQMNMLRVSVSISFNARSLQVAYLFRDHDDLLEEFTYFLPDSQAPHRAAMERQRLAAAQREHETSSRRQRLRADAVQPVCSQPIDLDIVLQTGQAHALGSTRGYTSTTSSVGSY